MSPLSIHIDFNRTTIPSTDDYWYVPHDVKRVNWNAKDYTYRTDGSLGVPRRVYIVDPVTGQSELSSLPYPEVYRVQPDHHTIVDCYWQRIWKDLNPDLDDKKWSTLMGSGLAWMNNTGSPPNRNCLTGENATEPFPRFDIPRTMGGAIHRGRQFGNTVYLESLNVSTRDLTANDVLSRWWLWHWAVSVNSKGEVNYITRIGKDGARYPVRVPFITTVQVSLPADQLLKLGPGQRPGPLDII